MLGSKVARLFIQITFLIALITPAFIQASLISDESMGVSVQNTDQAYIKTTKPQIPVQATEATSAPIQTESTNSVKNQIMVMAIRGQISKKSLESVRQSIGNVSGDPLPAGLIVLLDSPGGDGIAAMKIGEILRANKAHVFVTGQCASACIFILASGVVRAAPAYSIGIHRGRITRSDANAKILEEIDVKTNSQARELLERFEKLVPIYFSQMGMPPDLFQAMQSHQYKGVYRLSNEEINFYGLSGFDPKYLDSRAVFFESMKGAYHMDKDELHRRTLKVASRCAEYEQKHTEFINCYKHVLRDPFLN